MMTHEEIIKHDLEIFGIAYERKFLDGTIERIDPTTIRVIKAKTKENVLGFKIVSDDSIPPNELHIK